MSERAIFIAALEKDDRAERAAFLDQACVGDRPLRQRIERLLKAHEPADSFLEHRPPGLGVTVGEPPIAERPGAVIGPYKLMEKIGEGGMGLVFVAEQQEPVRRRVALKIIKPGMDSKQVIARFEAERQALAMMDHQNIAKVHDAGTTESGRPYFVMELVHGVPITDYCDANQLTPRQRLELFVPVCQAIQHAHQKGIIHRDIKPSNVLVTMYDDKPVPKVIDFGVAKAIDQRLTEKTVYTQFGTLVGTFEYMSPEQAELNAFGVDTRSDIYSLGVLLYELLTGTTPLERPRLREAAFDEIRRIIKEEEPPRPSVRLSTSGALAKVAAARKTDPVKLSRLMRGELDWVVMRCLEKDRSRRYDTASGLAKDVERYLKDEPVEARPPSATYRLRKLFQRNKTAVLTTAVVAAALLLGTAVSVWQASRASAERERAHRAEETRVAAQKQHDDEMAALVRRQALDEAIAAAMSGELDKAKKAIHDAELKGVSLGQVHWLQGLVHYQRSENELALEEFVQARKLMPESVAPLAMILRCVGPTSTKFPQVYQDMLRLTPTTPEDYLCRGFAAGLVEQKQPIPDLDKSIELRDSPIARTFRAAALTRIAVDLGDRNLMERAQEDLKRARVLLPGNSFVLRISLYVQLHAANLYARDGQTENRGRALEEAQGYADALKNNPLAASVMIRVTYFQQIGDDGAALDLLRQAADQNLSPELSYRYALALYQQGNLADAMKVLDRRKQPADDAGEILRIFLTAEQSEEGRRQAYESLSELVARRHRESRQPTPSWTAPAALLFLGKKKQAAEIVRGRTSVYVGLAGFLEEEDSEQAYFGKVHWSRYLSCSQHYWVGMTRLSEGDRKGAREAFKAAVDTGIYTMFSYVQSRIMLARLDSDPTWPKWIPVKK